MENQSNTFIFFGKSGSGKGTQAELLIENIEKAGEKTLYIETGQKFRDFVSKEDNHTSRMTREVLAKNELMPVFMPIWLWTGELVDNFTGEETLVLDGLCRREDEAVVLDSAMKFYKRKKPVVVYIKVSDEWALTRLKERGREDDTEEYLKKRVDWFEWQVKPAMALFHDNGDYHFLEINGEQPIEEVQAELVAKIEALG